MTISAVRQEISSAVREPSEAVRAVPPEAERRSTRVATTAGAAWAVADDTTTSDTTDGTDDASAERPSIVERITEALAGLVDDGTITEDQASAVAEELASSEELRGGPMGHGPHGGMGGMERPGLEAAAETLNLTEDELRSALRDGSSLAEIADEQGVAVEDLVDALVTAAEERLATAVDNGRIQRSQCPSQPLRLCKDIEQPVGAHPCPASRAGNTSSIIRSRSWSLICSQPAISVPVRWQPSQKPCRSRLHTPVHGVSTARCGCEDIM